MSKLPVPYSAWINSYIKRCIQQSIKDDRLSNYYYIKNTVSTGIILRHFFLCRIDGS